jgi:8-oxo-dGTP pyrophosphatase MutT (NUDIX family)
MLNTSFPASKHVAFERFNTHYNEFVNRLKTHQHKPFYSAGLFFDRKVNALLVKDNQDGGSKTWMKIPGGVSDQTMTFENFLQSLETELKKMKYSRALIGRIFDLEKDAEKKGRRNAAERTMILEFVEETGFYPVKFTYVADGYRYNKLSFKYDLWQVYFSVHAIISPSSEGTDDFIKEIRKMKTTVAIDVDVKDMRVAVVVEELSSVLGPATHKFAAKEICAKQAAYWNNFARTAVDSPNFMNTCDKLSKRYSFASMN